MQTYPPCSFSLPTPPLFSCQLKPRKRVFGGGPKHNTTKISAAKKDLYNRDYNGKKVDENMIVLRMRIHEMKMLEKKDEPPLHWMEWERRYENYDSDVMEVVGFLQSKLMDTRPGLALGMLALVLLSVPTSMTAVVLYLASLIKGF